jgi:hypothetical protein
LFGEHEVHQVACSAFVDDGALVRGVESEGSYFLGDPGGDALQLACRVEQELAARKFGFDHSGSLGGVCGLGKSSVCFPWVEQGRKIGRGLSEV